MGRENCAPSVLVFSHAQLRPFRQGEMEVDMSVAYGVGLACGFESFHSELANGIKHAIAQFPLHLHREQ